MPNLAVAYYQTYSSTHVGKTSMEVRKAALESFAEHHGLTIFRSFEGPSGSDVFTQAVSLSSEIDGLLLVTNDSTDEDDVRLMVNLTAQGIRFIAVNLFGTGKNSLREN
ncbi:hypothetical protein [Deinococcus peraridilitoris]|uniref:Uncharacterized protein n=1 Tax=Deinococcus peraridilitoris (strain DSM 19664 / LMG 22246 / CIP 109416 / KR-200) TaxID=937777 RepID=K9ZWX4_DEIPD|nr:hypothetical protein [Deinococcus peraridilitoris]AFZ65679.1 hypothetical protein Deipe_0071 [Deinococcus peraridilitoris DSM 19664]